ncbi:hypothetical protein [Halosimplex sp. J119]
MQTARRHRPFVETIAVAGIGVAVALAGTALLPVFLPDPPRVPAEAIPPLLSVFVRVELFVTTFNLVVLLALTKAYIGIYRELDNKYTRSLIALSSALLLYAFASNPLVHVLLGLQPTPDFGLFLFLPDLFVGVAIVVLYYQSQA